jgi:choline kinase
MKALTIVILAAGKGTRLGLGLPKALVELTPGHKLLDYQISNLSKVFKENVSLNVVVGFRKELFSEVNTRVKLIENRTFDVTNTAESLHLALTSVHPKNGVLWLNGDVYFDDKVLDLVSEKIFQSRSFLGVQFGEIDRDTLGRVSSSFHIICFT